MSATQKIDGLVNSWYGYAVFNAALAFWNRGIGVWSFVISALGFGFSLLVAWFFGNRLKNKSSLWRTLLVVGSMIGMGLGAVGSVRMGMSLLHSFELSTLFTMGIVVIGTFMNVKTFRVLTDTQVKAYINT